MTQQNIEDLLLDLLRWLTPGPRPYDEVLNAWRTSCPQLPVWETALDRRLVTRCSLADGRRGVSLTVSGRRAVTAPSDWLPGG